MKRISDVDSIGIDLIESDSSAAPSFTLGLQHSDAIDSSTPDEWRKLERLESREKDASSFRAMGIPEV